MRASRYLGRVISLNASIERKLAEKQRIKELATKATASLSGMPGAGGVSDRVGDAVARLIDVEEEINQAIDCYVDARAEVLGVLEAVPPDEYEVLHRYYVQGQTMEYIAEHISPHPVSVRHAYRLKSRALRRVQAMLDTDK